MSKTSGVMEPPSSDGASDLLALLDTGGGVKVKELVKDTDQAIDRIVADAGVSLSDSTQDAATKLATWAERMAESAAKGGFSIEELQKRVAAELATIDNDQAIAKQAGWHEDLRTAVLGLTAEQQQFAQFLTTLDGECPEADAEIKNSEIRVEKARNAIPYKEMELQTAQQMKRFLNVDWGGKKKDAIALATTELEEAKTELEEAKADIEPAKIRAEEIRRQRLMNARPEELLNLILAKGMKVVETGMQRAEILAKEEAQAVKERIQVVKDRQVAQETLDKLNTALADQEQVVINLTEEIERTADPSERAKLETELSNQKEALQRAGNNRNKAFLYSQSKQRMAELLEQTEEAARSLRASIEGMCIMLKSDLQTRETVYRAGVEALKAAADMKVLSSSDQVGAKTDQNMLEMMASTALAAQRTVAETMAAHPLRFEAMRKVRELMSQQTAQVDDSMQQQLQDFFRNYGINPTDANAVNYRTVPTAG